MTDQLDGPLSEALAASGSRLFPMRDPATGNTLIIADEAGLAGRIRALALAEEDTVNPAYGFTPKPGPLDLSLVALCREGRPLGHISISVEPPRKGTGEIGLWISGVFVDAGHRGQGIGRALAEAAAHLAGGTLDHIRSADPALADGLWWSPGGDANDGGQAILGILAAELETLEPDADDAPCP
ncbi:GNAT family N-acetyltransferase [Defluviimonas salinarum]|uniref:GNAT family N-acetyltransferase n=1 Tax=Defluviimonas salinarum TaxID=2992147 RepID=A0ABT3J481_9RHOB|nr:GNAT family N-acetyltransferase [Defluviimonas salinarum]MCW3782476.1 GNAT family N-acetyltransferase [Defluviimonas salinarum]